MPLQRGWTADVVRRAERFLSLLPDKDLEVVVKQFAPSVPLKCKDDFSAAPRLVLKALAEQYYPDELLEGFALMQKKNMVKFFKDSLGPENCSPRLYEADADELRRWMLEYWFNVRVTLCFFAKKCWAAAEFAALLRDLHQIPRHSAQSIWST